MSATLTALELAEQRAKTAREAAEKFKQVVEAPANGHSRRSRMRMASFQLLLTAQYGCW